MKNIMKNLEHYAIIKLPMNYELKQFACILNNLPLLLNRNHNKLSEFMIFYYLTSLQWHH